MTTPKRTPKKPTPARKRREVALDEPQTVDPPARPLVLGAGFDPRGLGEELAETFVENVTGADDAATEHRAVVTASEKRGPFVRVERAGEAAPVDKP